LIGLSFPQETVATIDLRPSITQFHEKLNDWSEKEKFTDGQDYSVRLMHVNRSHALMKEIREIGGENLFRQDVFDWLKRGTEDSAWSAPLATAGGQPVAKKQRLQIGIVLGQDV
jgi:hypothetical protein